VHLEEDRRFGGAYLPVGADEAEVKVS